MGHKENAEEQKFQFESENPSVAKIKVIGIGGAGSNAVDAMCDHGLGNVQFYVLNTDLQALKMAKCSNKIQIGEDITAGLGTGGDPVIGEKAALSAKEIIADILKDTDMLFITAGMGGGTGTGSSPVVAEIAKEMGALTVAVVTRPFRFEGPQRIRKAEQGIERLREVSDTVIVISNERLLEVVGPTATLVDAFRMANNVLAQGVRSISDLISVPGLINVDFADLKAVMGETGGAVMGVGVGKGENRAAEAVRKACSNPLLDKIVIDGAKGILICIAGGNDMRLNEINEATTLVYEAADPDANIIFGAVTDPNLKDELKVTIIATGFFDEARQIQPVNEENRIFPSSTAPVSLKEKLKVMMAGDPDRRQKAEPARASDEHGMRKTTVEPTAARANPKSAKTPQQNVLEFNRPDNPLRQDFTPTSQTDQASSDTHGSGDHDLSAMAKQPDAKRERDLETPAFLRRRKSLFD